VWLAVHRIVRECLTNAGRHAPGRPVSVGVRWTADAVTVTSTNATDGRARPTAGRGLAGMRHRAEILGGTFTAGADDGRFTVRVTLPVAAR
jgi:signal transduction histidine kinase